MAPGLYMLTLLTSNYKSIQILGDIWITLVFSCKISINIFTGRAWFLLVHCMVSYVDFASVSTLLHERSACRPRIAYVKSNKFLVLLGHSLKSIGLNIKLRHWPSTFTLLVEIGYRALRAVSNGVSYSRRNLHKKRASGNRPAHP